MVLNRSHVVLLYSRQGQVISLTIPRELCAQVSQQLLELLQKWLYFEISLSYDLWEVHLDEIFNKLALSSIKQHRAGRLHSVVITLLICTLLPQTEPQWGETGNCKCSSWNIMSRKRVIKSSDRAQWSRSIWKFLDKGRVRFFLPSLVTVWQTQQLNLPLSNE